MAQAFSALPFDHLVFTGSTAVGRKGGGWPPPTSRPPRWSWAASRPCIIDTSCDLQDAALKIAHGKLLNAGQTCIAPDYVLLPRGSEAAFADAYRAAVARLFPSIAGNQDYASIISPRHLARLRTMLQQAQTQGADVQNMDPARRHARPGRRRRAGRRHQPPDGARAGVWRHLGHAAHAGEIFGPILPVVSYERLDDAIAHINAGPRPLALYWFGANGSVRDDVLARTVSGGVSVNDTLMHIAHDNLPFGGVGDSGWGLPRRVGLPALLPPEVGAGAVALGHGFAVLPAVWPAFRPGHGPAAPLALKALCAPLPGCFGVVCKAC